MRTCVSCGSEFSPDQHDSSQCPSCIALAHEQRLIEDASHPSLATLYKRGKQAGLISPQRAYVNF